MKMVEALNEVFIELCMEKQNQFVHEILYEWDNQYGMCPSFQHFVEMRMVEKWNDLYMRN